MTNLNINNAERVINQIKADIAFAEFQINKCSVEEFLTPEGNAPTTMLTIDEKDLVERNFQVNEKTSGLWCCVMQNHPTDTFLYLSAKSSANAWRTQKSLSEKYLSMYMGEV
jgi:hypothetical protein|tara:strand:+ start:471 stop:806 length:336 start_codon:yes stop_codon:yes gene_type:complete